MTGCVFPTPTQADVAALGDIERATVRAANGCKAALLRASRHRHWQRLPDGSGRPRLLTGLRNVCVPNHARHVSPILRQRLASFGVGHWPDAVSAEALCLMWIHTFRASHARLRIKSGIRPRRVTADGLVIVRGRR